MTPPHGNATNAVEQRASAAGTSGQLGRTAYRSDRLVVLELTGELDLAVAADLRASLAEATARPGTTIVLDFNKVGFLDSSAIAVIVAAAKRATAEHGRLLAVNVSGLTGRVMALTGVRQIFPIYEADGRLDGQQAAPLSEVARAFW